MYYVYGLYSRELNKFYIGVTEDLARRIQEHKGGQTHTTHRLGEWELSYYEACQSKQDATRRERQLKTGFGRAYLRKRLQSYLMGA